MQDSSLAYPPLSFLHPPARCVPSVNLFKGVVFRLWNQRRQSHRSKLFLPLPKSATNQLWWGHLQASPVARALFSLLPPVTSVFVWKVVCASFLMWSLLSSSLSMRIRVCTPSLSSLPSSSALSSEILLLSLLVRHPSSSTPPPSYHVRSCPLHLFFVFVGSIETCEPCPLSTALLSQHIYVSHFTVPLLFCSSSSVLRFRPIPLKCTFGGTAVPDVTTTVKSRDVLVVVLESGVRIDTSNSC